MQPTTRSPPFGARHPLLTLILLFTTLPLPRTLAQQFSPTPAPATPATPTPTYPASPSGISNDPAFNFNAQLDANATYTAGDGGLIDANATGTGVDVMPSTTLFISGDAAGAAGGVPVPTGAGGAGAGQWPGGAAGAGAAGGGQWPDMGGGGMMGSAGGWRRPEWVDQVPLVRIAHASVGIATVLFVFPFGAIIHRVWDHTHNVWVHATVQMVGYLMFLTTAAMGIWMGAVQKKIAGYHPIMGLIILGLLTIQPFTELINHFLFQRYPKIIYVGYVHIYVGRMLIATGLVHGGLGFTYSAKLDRELPNRPGPYPLGVHVTYGVLAGLVGVGYTAIMVWKQTQNMRRMSNSGVVEEAGNGGGGGEMMVRLEEHALSEVRASVRKASESAQTAPGTPDGGGTAVSGALTPVAAASDSQVSSSAVGEPAASTTSPKPAPVRMSSIKKIFKSDAL